MKTVSDKIVEAFIGLSIRAKMSGGTSPSTYKLAYPPLAKRRFSL